MAIKYIRTKDNAIVVFPRLYNHDEVARKFGGALSAGFISFAGEDTKCYGKSISLNMVSDPEDSHRAVTQFYYI